MNTNSLFKEESLRLARWVLFCLGFGLLPLFLIFLGLGQKWEYASQKKADFGVDRLSRLLERVRQDGSARSFFYDRLEKLCQTFDKNPAPGESIPSVVGPSLLRLQKMVPGLLEFSVTDTDGNLISSLSTGLPSKFIVKKLYEGVRQAEKSLSFDHLLKQKKTIEVFLGETGNLDDLLKIHTQKQVAAAGLGGKHTFFFYKYFSWGSMWIHINQEAVAPTFTYDSLVKRLNRKNSQLVFGVHSLGKPLNTGSCLEEERRLVTRSLGSFEHSIQEFFVYPGHLLVVMVGSGNTYLWALFRRNPIHDPFRWQTEISISFLFLWVVFSAISYGFMVPQNAHWLSIRHKLVGLLGIAAGFPLIVLMVTEQDYLREKEQSLTSKRYRQMEQVLKGFDGKFLLKHRLYAVRLKKLVHDSGDESGNFSFPLFRRAYRKLEKNMELPFPMIIQRDGTIIQSRDSDNVLHQLSIAILARYNLSLGISEDEDSRKNYKLDAFFASDKQINDLVNSLLKNLRTINRIIFARLNKFLFMDIIAGPSGIGNCMLFFMWTPSDLMYDYIFHSLMNRQRDLSESRLFALNPHDPLERNIPVGVEKIDWMKIFLRRIQSRGVFTTDLVSWRGKRYLVAGMPGKELEGFYLVQAIPHSVVSNVLESTRKNLYGLAILSMFMAFAVGIALARQFLLPVANLATGVTAIGNQQFRHRIPFLENDELGLLSATFNNMMEGLEQLSIARTVQKTLFPDDSMTVGDWQVFGRNIPATDLGGDYFDFIEVEGNRLAVLIGDVSGHGVSAALIMAMAKALVAYEVKRDPSPANILSMLNRTLYEVSIKNQMMMTFFYALAEADGRTVRFTNAGHCAPIHFRKGKEPVELKFPSFPLGIRKVQKYVDRVLEMEPGERLFLYTDGLPETQIRPKEMLGYDYLRGSPFQQWDMTLADQCHSIFTQLDKFRGDNPQDDDVTLIFLERKQTNLPPR